MSAPATAGSWLDRIGADATLWSSLSDDARFASAAEWFDTTVVLESGDRAIFLKIYRGRVIDTGRGHGFKGYAFALSAAEAAWAEVLGQGSSGLHRALTSGEVRVRGDLIEFNRAIKLVSLLVDAIAARGTWRGA